MSTKPRFVRVNRRSAVRAIFKERIGQIAGRSYLRNPAELTIAPDAHLFIVLMRRHKRVIVAQIDSKEAWDDFQQFYPVIWQHELKFTLLSRDEYRRIMAMIDPSPGQRRFADSQWHLY